jgi:hypothetical protein
VIRALVVVLVALVCAPVALGAKPAPKPKPVPSLTPAATQKLWKTLVRNRQVRMSALSGECRPLRSVFYAATDWLRLATKLAASGSPCADSFISVPPIVGDKTQQRADQAWRIRALGPNFHALAEISFNAWSSWVSTTGGSWYSAGVQARKNMAAAGYDVTKGDSWVLNELSSAVRRGDGNARANISAFVRGLYTGDGALPAARGAVFITGIGQGTLELSTYQSRLQDWFEDAGFWADMEAYVSDWSQELYGDFRTYAVPGADLTARRNALNAYLQHELALVRAGPSAAAGARAFLEHAYSPLANAAWQHESGFGFTFVPVDQMQHFVSAQVYALRSASAQAAQDHAGFAWAPKNLTGSTDFTTETGALLDRLAAAIRDSGVPDAEDPGIGACAWGVWCRGEIEGGWFNNGWASFAQWKPSVLAFATSPQTLSAGTPSAALTVDLRTFSSVLLPATSTLPVTVSTTSPGGEFAVAPSGPWTKTLTTGIAVDSATTSFYYRDTTAGSAVLTAAASGKTAAAQSVTVQAAPLAALTLAPASFALPTGGSQELTATGVDAYGNAVPAVGLAWSLAAGTPGTIAVTSETTAVFTAGSSGGTGAILASSGSASVQATVTVQAPATARVASIVYTQIRRDLLVTVALVDGAGKPLARTAVAVAIDRSGVPYASRTPTTGADGRAAIMLLKTPSGCYTASVTSVGAPGWDGSTPTNRFCR